MKTFLTTLSNQLYIASRFRLTESAKHFGVDEIYSYDLEEIKKTSFYLNNKEILDSSRGIGYWLWKPYIISETLKKANEGDIVMYIDAGIEIIASLEPLYEICKQQSVLLFANGNLKNFGWTKRDCFVLMNCDNKLFWNSVQCDASSCIFKKSDVSVRFVEEWLTYCCDKRIMTDMPNTCGKKNLFGFIQHRYDQSVLSLLAYRDKITLFRTPTQFGNHYKAEKYRVQNEFNCVNQIDQHQLKYYSKHPYKNSPYYQLLNHHRTKNTKVSENKNKASVRMKIKRRAELFFYKLAFLLNKIK
jgi:hypothetical protein